MTIFQYKEWYAKKQDEILRDYFTFLSFPSISTDPAHIQDVRNCAEWLKSYLQKIGCTCEIWETSHHPIVYATHLKAGPERPTLLIYQHYDVQPVDPLHLWTSNPFKPTLRGNRVYARGASDNKGQCFYALTAIRAFLELADRVNVNLKIFIEGEEESGSPGTSALLPHKHKELQADHLLVNDFGLLEDGAPALALGMRGLVCCTVELACASTDLHSGVHGGIALNPNRALSSILGNMWDEKGQVTIPGFYDDIAPFQHQDVDFSFNREEYQKKFGVKAFSTEEGFSPKEANALRPSLEINGLSGGYSGPGVKTVIPAKAEAKLSCRLVPNQDPEKTVQSILEFIRKRTPPGVELDAQVFPGAPAFRVSSSTPIVKYAQKAMEEAFQAPCTFYLCGATVPIIHELQKASGAEVALIGMGLDEDDIHAPNEHFSLDRLETGFLTMTGILSKIV